MDRRSDPTPDTVAVIGLGRFGGQVAHTLTRLGCDVLGIDSNIQVVQRLTGELAHVVRADATDVGALRRLGVEDLHTVVVGIGDDPEASVLTVLVLVELNVPDVWARAATGRHGQILRAVGAHHVIDATAAIGERVAHRITSRIVDYIEIDEGFAVAATRTPAWAANRTLADAELDTEFGVTLVGVKRPGEDFTDARPDTVVGGGDLLVVAGRTDLIQRFAAG